MAAAASSSARAFLQLLRPRQHQQLPSLRLRLVTSTATAPAGVASRRCFFLLLQQQPHRCWAVVSGGCDELEEGEAVVADCGGEQAARGDGDGCCGKGAVSPAAKEAQQAAGRGRSSSSPSPSTYTPTSGRPRNRAAMPRGKGGRGGPAPPGGGPPEGKGGVGGSHH